MRACSVWTRSVEGRKEADWNSNHIRQFPPILSSTSTTGIAKCTHWVPAQAISDDAALALCGVHLVELAQTQYLRRRQDDTPLGFKTRKRGFAGVVPAHARVAAVPSGVCRWLLLRLVSSSNTLDGADCCARRRPARRAFEAQRQVVGEGGGRQTVDTRRERRSGTQRLCTPSGVHWGRGTGRALLATTSSDALTGCRRRLAYTSLRVETSKTHVGHRPYKQASMPSSSHPTPDLLAAAATTPTPRREAEARALQLPSAVGLLGQHHPAGAGGTASQSYFRAAARYAPLATRATECDAFSATPSSNTVAGVV
uniref:Uncharacterized protein n=1 Tax=Mycena chlorophos TaxID=658473 RepID=A0ABQ0LNN3_MYCCL|nr:predicted protein [Mycena chlorophos]